MCVVVFTDIGAVHLLQAIARQFGLEILPVTKPPAPKKPAPSQPCAPFSRHPTRCDGVLWGSVLVLAHPTAFQNPSCVSPIPGNSLDVSIQMHPMNTTMNAPHILLRESWVSACVNQASRRAHITSLTIQISARRVAPRTTGAPVLSTGNEDWRRKRPRPAASNTAPGSKRHVP